jgi:hypothetical protein
MEKEERSRCSRCDSEFTDCQCPYEKEKTPLNHLCIYDLRVWCSTKIKKKKCVYCKYNKL